MHHLTEAALGQPSSDRLQLDTACRLRGTIARYNDTRRVEELRLDEGPEQSARFASADWRATVSRQVDPVGGVCWRVDARVVAGSAIACSVGFLLEMPGWTRDHYLLMPSVVYAGNRFEVRKLAYSPRHPEPDCRKDAPTLVTDVPRLNLGEGPSRIQLLAGGMSMPAFAVFDPARRRGLIVLAPAEAEVGEVGFDFTESNDRRHAELRITVPGVRETRYSHMNTERESQDRAADFSAGASLRFSIRVHEFDAEQVQDLFDRLFELRSAMLPPAIPPTELPFSTASSLVEQHYNRDFWWDAAGLYRVHPVDSYTDNPYQTGWCGGIIAEAALLADTDDPLTRGRSIRHLDNATGPGMVPTGLFFGKYARDAWRSDCELDTKRPYRKSFTLVRRQGDALLYLLRAMEHLEARGESAPARWGDAARRSANALCEIWRREGQFGQFIDQFSGEIRVGGSASGAIIPAALAEAFRRYHDRRFLDVGMESAAFFHEKFTRRGITTGGPGDALQCPDSESSYALVESFVTLFDVTADPRWLDAARDAAHQFATRVVPYDYRFPRGSMFDRLGIRAAGAVFANAQNGHAAPGICTHSGLGLFKLFRHTGDRRYLDLLCSIARALPQYVARDDRPIVAQDGRTLPSGWINERCNTSDWDDNHGGVFYGPCWPEVSLLLTRAELPGLYVQPDTGLLCMLDNLDVERIDTGSRGLRLRIANPTKFDAVLTVFAETNADTTRPLRLDYAGRFQRVSIPAGGEVEHQVSVD